MNDIDYNEASYLAAHPDVAAAVAKRQFKTGWEHYQAYGKREGRALRPDITREGKVLFAIDRRGKGLEIGPSYNPIAAKKHGFDVQILDYLSADQLRDKYRGHVSIDSIEEVDFVWSGQPLHELVGRQACYDWIIASHVIEHVPDLISFLIQCQILLKPEGRLSLVVPDKRYCFDHFGMMTSTGNLLDAYAEKRTHPSPGTVFDHVANATKFEGNVTWHGGSEGENYELIHTLDQARDLWQQVSKEHIYVDSHCWRFVPESFLLILSDLNMLGLIQLGIAQHFPTVGCEFFVTLGRDIAASSQDRMAALKSIATLFEEPTTQPEAAKPG